MKQFGLVALLIIVCLVFAGCPVSTSFPLQSVEKGYIDASLYGKWKNDSTDAEAREIEISPYDANSFKIKVLHKGSMYMAETDSFKAWFCNLGTYNFLVLQQIENGSLADSYFVYRFIKSGANLITNDISLKVNGTDAIKSIETYQEEVLASSSKSGFLSMEIIWTRKTD